VPRRNRVAGLDRHEAVGDTGWTGGLRELRSLALHIHCSWQCDTRREAHSTMQQLRRALRVVHDGRCNSIARRRESQLLCGFVHLNYVAERYLRTSVNRIVLISCASRKLQHRAKAADLYVSHLFRLSLAFARKLRPEALFILSAKHGLLHPDHEVDPYDLTLNRMSTREVRAWSDMVFDALLQRTNVERDHFIFLAGDRYRRFLEPRLRSVETPMAGLRIGKQLQYLKRHLD
jgi:hypothetical protein